MTRVFTSTLSKMMPITVNKRLLNKYVRQVLFPPPVEYKEYRNKTSVSLPKNNNLNTFLLGNTLELRKTVREFSVKKLSLKEISTILLYGFGINTNLRDKIHRYYPSAGGKYPLECYLISNKTNLNRGIYHYNVQGHSLELLSKVIPQHLDEYVPQFAENIPPLFIMITGVARRTTKKYGARGRRYLLLEAGHVGQNIQLVCSALNINSVPMGGGFNDKKIERLIGIQSSSETLLYMFSLGHEKR